ncbi:MAG: TrkA family potassium uptake protein [Candidatus Aenigmatarchaeota archaeon]|nr:MAG: TrkA family potassium uptake protein [Candidatus Aenigmarchaeota archaeon]
MKIIIAGGGQLGTKLAELCAKEKHDVVVVEKEEKVAENLGEKLDALILRGDATDRKILKDGNIEHCDALVALTGDDKTNLMICEVAKDFKVPTIVARVNDTSSEEIFMKLGITASINTTTSAVFAFKKAIEKPGERLISLVAGEKAEIFEKVVSNNSQLINRTLNEVVNEFIICAIYRSGDLVKPKPNTKIQEGDIIVICAPVESVKKVRGLF